MVLEQDRGDVRLDRSLRSLEAAVRATAEAEDAFAACLGAPVLRDDSRRQRRSLLLVAVLAVSITVLGLRPTKVQPLEIELGDAEQLWIVYGAGVAILYFWVEFLLHAGRDFRYWSERLRTWHRRWDAALRQEIGQIREGFDGSDQQNLEVAYDEKHARFAEVHRPAPPRRFASILGAGSAGWLEFRLPQALAFIALACVAREIWLLTCAA